MPLALIKVVQGFLEQLTHLRNVKTIYEFIKCSFLTIQFKNTFFLTSVNEMINMQARKHRLKMCWQGSGCSKINCSSLDDNDCIIVLRIRATSCDDFKT